MMGMLYEGLSFFSILLGACFTIVMYPKRRWGKWCLFVVSILLFCLCGWQAWNSKGYYASNLGIIVYPLLASIPIAVLYQCAYYKAVIWQWLYQVTLSIFKLPLLMLGGILGKKRLYEINYGNRTLAECGWQLFLILVTLLVLFWTMKKAIAGSVRYFLDKYWYLLVGGFLLTWMLYAGIYEKDIVVQQSDFIDSLIMCFVLVSMFWFMWWFFGLKQEEKRNISIRQSAIQREQSLIKKRYEQNAKQMHDLKYEMRCLDQYIATGQYDKARKYLANYTERLGKSNKGVWTGILTVDASVDYYYSEMQEKNIQFRFDVDVHHIPMSETDVMVIFGNLLDNAVEATSKCKEDNRWVTMKIKNVNEIICMEVSNSCTQLPKKNGELFATTKREKSIHGYGLSNVCQMVYKNGGEICFDYTAERFTVRIMLQGQN